MQHVSYLKKPAVRACSVGGCDHVYYAKGLCNMHYLRVRSTGTHEKRRRVFETTESKLSRLSTPVDSGCTVWLGYRKDEDGYGRIVHEGKGQLVHRVAWALANGPIPTGLQINHTCHNRLCIKADHLYAGTQKQNMKDMIDAGRNRKGFYRAEAQELLEKAARQVGELPQVGSHS